MTQNAPRPENHSRLYGFDWLRFWAILAVVCIHSSDIALRKNRFFPVQTGESVLYYAFSACLRFCVPVFLMMAAFFMERRWNGRGQNALRRLVRLAFPMLAASLFYLVIFLLQTRMEHKPVPWNALPLLALTGRLYYHLWFLFALLCFSLLHGLLRRLTAPLPMGLLLLVTVLVFAGSDTLLARYVVDNPAPLMQQIASFSNLVLSWPYYVLGIWAANNTARLNAWPSRSVYALTVCGFLACGLYGVLLRQCSFFNPATLLLSIAMFCVALRAITLPPPFVAQVARLSLGIYLWHPLVLLILRIAQGRYYREAVSPLLTFILMLAETIGAVGGSYLISLALSKVRPLRGLAQ